MRMLTDDERRSLGCTCTRLDDVWHHVRFCPVPAVERIVQQRVDAAKAEALAPIEAMADKWDGLSKGESPTTRQLRAAIRDGRGVPS